MKKAVLILMSVLALTACNNSKSNTSKTDNEQIKTKETTKVGRQKDEHGCLTSAGETWSQLKQDCIQIFNVGQRLNPIETKEGEAVISAFILFNDDKTKAEIFLQNTKNSSILNHTDKDLYEAGEYKYDTKDALLYINDTKTYSAAK